MTLFIPNQKLLYFKFQTLYPVSYSQMSGIHADKKQKMQCEESQFDCNDERCSLIFIQRICENNVSLKKTRDVSLDKNRGESKGGIRESKKRGSGKGCNSFFFNKRNREIRRPSSMIRINWVKIRQFILQLQFKIIKENQKKKEIKKKNIQRFLIYSFPNCLNSIHFVLMKEKIISKEFKNALKKKNCGKPMTVLPGFKKQSLRTNIKEKKNFPLTRVSNKLTLSTLLNSKSPGKKNQKKRKSDNGFVFQQEYHVMTAQEQAFVDLKTHEHWMQKTMIQASFQLYHQLKALQLNHISFFKYPYYPFWIQSHQELYMQAFIPLMFGHHRRVFTNFSSLTYFNPFLGLQLKNHKQEIKDYFLNDELNQARYRAVSNVKLKKEQSRLRHISALFVQTKLLKTLNYLAAPYSIRKTNVKKNTLLRPSLASSLRALKHKDLLTGTLDEMKFQTPFFFQKGLGLLPLQPLLLQERQKKQRVNKVQKLWVLKMHIKPKSLDHTLLNKGPQQKQTDQSHFAMIQKKICLFPLFKLWLKRGLVQKNSFNDSNDLTLDRLIQCVHLKNQEMKLSHFFDTFRGSGMVYSIYFNSELILFSYSFSLLDKIKSQLRRQVVGKIALTIANKNIYIQNGDKGFDFLGWRFHKTKKSCLPFASCATFTSFASLAKAREVKEAKEAKLPKREREARRVNATTSEWEKRCSVSKKSLSQHQKKVKYLTKTCHQPDQLILRLNSLIKEWLFYNQNCSNLTALSGKLNQFLFKRLIKWSKRRHSNKTTRWVLGRYWKKSSNRLTFYFKAEKNKTYILMHYHSLNKFS